MENNCALCDREKELTFHHLIPKKNHSKNWCKRMFTKIEMKTRGIHVCRDCHSAIHRFISHVDLGKIYNTKKMLMTHPEIRKFVTWVSRQRKKAKK